LEAEEGDDDDEEMAAEEDAVHEAPSGPSGEHLDEDQETPADQEDKDAAEQEDNDDEPVVTKKKKNKRKKSKQPDIEDLLRSTDFLFLHADKDNVTVADVIKALGAEYDCKLAKSLRKQVRTHLVDLMLENVLPSVENHEEEAPQESDQESAVGQADDDSEDDEAFESEQDIPKPKKGRKVKKTGKKTSVKNKKASSKRKSSKTIEDEEQEGADLQESEQESTVGEGDDAEEEAPESEESDFEDDAAKRKNRRKSKTSAKKKPKKTKKAANKRMASKTEEDDGEEGGADLPESDQESEIGQAEDDSVHASDTSEYEDDEQPRKQKTRKPKKLTKKKLSKPKPQSKRKAAKAARMIEAERLRKKRMEELRVRNEEMQLDQSREEKERSEKIAARFETNTDELKAKRLEDRLNLLQALDRKRVELVEIKDEEPEQEAAPEKEAEVVHESENEDESSDDEGLEIVGAAKPAKPLAPIHTHYHSKALDILKKLKSPEGKQQKTKVVLSPGTKSMSARNALRHKLKAKQRAVGNRWLARELGYKTEKEHLQDCQAVAQKKREQVVKIEQLRVKANERKQLRERLRLGDAPADEDDEEEFNADDTQEPEEEENEELQLAREIEKEQAPEASPSPLVTETSVVDEETSQVTVEDTDIAGAENEEPVDESQDTFVDSQRWETQPPTEPTTLPRIPVSQTPRIVSADSTDEHARELQPKETETSSVKVSGKAAQNDINSPSPEADITDEGDDELEFVDEAPASMDAPKKTETKDPNRPRNAGWQAMLKKEAEMLKKQKKRRKAGELVDAEAEEEEEEEVAGLEDFGFSVKKTKGEDEEDRVDDELDEDDLKHVVDDLSDDEGDEEAGQKARKREEQREEKERHKEMLRRMREGYDGRRGGIAGGGVGARGVHRFDQLVAADNREDAKRLGLLNDDEMESDDEEKANGDNKDEEEDETALLDKMLKDRFLHRSNVDLGEDFSDSDEDDQRAENKETGDDQSDDEEERTQERLAKRFAKRARMQRLEEIYSESQEFSQQRLIDEDKSMKMELQSMKNGLVRKRSVSNSRSSFSDQSTANSQLKRQRSGGSFGGSFMDKGGSLSVALRASRTGKQRTSFLGGAKAGDGKGAGAQFRRSVSLNHAVFQNSDSRSISKGISNLKRANSTGKRKERPGVGSSLFGKVAGQGQ